MSNNNFIRLSKEVKNCKLCAAYLPHKPRPIFQLHPGAKILIAGQAPGRKVNETGIPFDDPSGERLRKWMGIDKSIFYDNTKIALLPMGFCFPGSGRSGDLPPRPECAKKWRPALLNTLPHIQLTLVIGKYAQAWHMPDKKQDNLTKTVMAWREYFPSIIPLPHPSPRNNIWLHKNPWFENEVIPNMKIRISEILKN